MPGRYYFEMPFLCDFNRRQSFALMAVIRIELTLTSVDGTAVVANICFSTKHKNNNDLKTKIIWNLCPFVILISVGCWV